MQRIYLMTKKYFIFIFTFFFTSIIKSANIYEPLISKKIYPIIYLSKVKRLNEAEIKKIINLFFNKKIRAFLNLISFTEYTAINTKNNLINTPEIKEYMIVFGGTISDTNAFFLNHPGEKGFIVSITDNNGNQLRSTASGRYQFLLKTWQYLEKIFQKDLFKEIYLNSIIETINKKNELYNDSEKIYNSEDDFFYYSFGPFWQDLGAIILMYYADAIDDIINDNFETAIFKLAPVWASLPKDESNLSYYNGQTACSLEKCLNTLKEKIKNL
jgi:muramidase (phage lysozyme)